MENRYPVYPVNFDCEDCADDGYCMVWGHPCSSIDCTAKDDEGDE